MGWGGLAGLAFEEGAIGVVALSEVGEAEMLKGLVEELMGLYCYSKFTSYCTLDLLNH